MAGQGITTEAQLRCKTPSNNGNNTPATANAGNSTASNNTASNQLPGSSADLRRPSSASVMSSSSMDAGQGLLPTSGTEGHVPHMLCKWPNHRPSPARRTRKPCARKSESAEEMNTPRECGSPSPHDSLTHHVCGEMERNMGKWSPPRYVDISIIDRHRAAFSHVRP
jgi:hypothetical protein